MGTPVESFSRVLVTFTTEGVADYTLGAPLAAMLGLSAAGVISGQTISYFTSDNIYDDPNLWEKGKGVATLAGGVWTVTRTVRTNNNGNQNKVPYGSGLKYFFISLDPEDLAFLDSEGFLGLGGVTNSLLANTGQFRTRDAPIDVIRGTGVAGLLMRLRKPDGSSAVDISNTGLLVASGVNSTFGAQVTMNGSAPIAAVAATAANHLTRKDYVDALIYGRLFPLNFYWTTGGDPGAVEVTFANVTLPNKCRYIRGTMSIDMANGANASAFTARTYIMNNNGAVAQGPSDYSATQIANARRGGAWPIVYDFSAGGLTPSTPSPWQLRFNGYRDLAGLVLIHYGFQGWAITDP